MKNKYLVEIQQKIELIKLFNEVFFFTTMQINADAICKKSVFKFLDLCYLCYVRIIQVYQNIKNSKFIADVAHVVTRQNIIMCSINKNQMT